MRLSDLQRRKLVCVVLAFKQRKGRGLDGVQPGHHGAGHDGWQVSNDGAIDLDLQVGGRRRRDDGRLRRRHAQPSQYLCRVYPHIEGAGSNFQACNLAAGPQLGSFLLILLYCIAGYLLEAQAGSSKREV